MAAQSRPTLLITRPAASGARFAEGVRAQRGDRISIILSPLMQTRFLAPQLPPSLEGGDVRGVLFTSESGVRGLARLWPRRDLPAWCVGDQTAAAARDAGWQAQALGGDAQAMADAIVTARLSGPLLHARGADVTAGLSARLAAAGIALTELVVYEQVPLPLSGAARAALDGQAPVIVPVFSPRSARLFAASAAGSAAPLLCAAISVAAAEPLHVLRPAALAVAARPDAESMTAAVVGLVDAVSAA